MLKLLLLVCFLVAVQGYSIDSNFTGANFFGNFNFWTGADPTHGYVFYASQDQANQWGLIKTSASNVYMGSDHDTASTGSGRASVRLTSKKAWTYGLFILDLEHMPIGCGTWPAWWTVGPNWPNAGEIDIIEGVNEQTFDQSTLHTNPGCTVGSGDFSGHLIQSNCAAAGNAGCGITTTDHNPYGRSFNNQKGGVYAMEWTANFIRMFYWPRGSIPGDVSSSNPNPNSWGKPYAYFALGGSCPNSHFHDHNMVFDLTFCGDWAGAVFGSQCPGKGACNDFVQKNPAAFAEAYWIINSARVYK